MNIAYNVVEDSFNPFRSMHTTQLTLIQNLSSGKPIAWLELDRIYRPLIHKWIAQYRLQSSDVDDLTQEVMTIVLREINGFEHNGRLGAFRKWLRLTTVNVARNFLRKKKGTQGTGSTEFLDMLGQLEDAHSDVSRRFDLQHDRFVIRRLLDMAAANLDAKTLNIFRVHVVEGCSVPETAKQLNVANASVHTAKSRVLRKLRQLAQECLEEEYF